MNRNTAATEARDGGKPCAGSTRWSSEWSFIEDADIALQKPTRLPIAGKQAAGAHASANPGSS